MYRASGGFKCSIGVFVFVECGVSVKNVSNHSYGILSHWQGGFHDVAGKGLFKKKKHPGRLTG